MTLELDHSLKCNQKHSEYHPTYLIEIPCARLILIFGSFECSLKAKAGDSYIYERVLLKTDKDQNKKIVCNNAIRITYKNLFDLFIIFLYLLCIIIICEDWTHKNVLNIL